MQFFCILSYIMLQKRDGSRKYFGFVMGVLTEYNMKLSRNFNYTVEGLNWN